MLAAVAKRLTVLGLVFALAIVLAAGLAAPKAQAAVATNATLTVSTSVDKPTVNPLCIVIAGVLGGTLCQNKTISNAVDKGAKKLVAPIAKKAVGAAVGAAAGPVGTAVFGSINSAIQAASLFMLGLVGKFYGNIQTPNLQSSWFFSIYDRIVALSLILLFVMMVAAILIALCTWNAQRLLAALRGMFIAVLVAFGMPFMLQVLLLFSDSIASEITGGSKTGGSSFASAVSGLVTQMSGDSSVPVWISIAVMAFVWLAAFLLYIELLVRSVCLYAGLLFAPIAYSSRVMGGWGQRMSVTLMRNLLALIFAVPLMVALLVLGATAMAHIPNVPGLAIGKPMIAAVTLFLALLSPIALQAWARQLHVAVQDSRAERAQANGGATTVVPLSGADGAHRRIENMRVTQVVAAHAQSADTGSKSGRIVESTSKVLSHPVTLTALTVGFGPEAAGAAKAIGAAGGLASAASAAKTSKGGA